MKKQILSYGFLIVPGMILMTLLLMLIRPGAVFQFRFNASVDPYPGSAFEFLFGFSADGDEIVQVNPVGVFMLLLIVIAVVIPFAGKTLRHRFAWQGFLLSVSSVLMIVFPFLSLIGKPFLDRIEMGESFDVPVTITYSLGIPLILAALILLAAGILAFLLDREKLDPKKQWANLLSGKRKTKSKKRSSSRQPQKNHAKWRPLNK